MLAAWVYFSIAQICCTCTWDLATEAAYLSFLSPRLSILDPPPYTAACHVINKLVFEVFEKILHYTVLSSHLLEGMLQLHNPETACSILKQWDEGEGVWSRCWAAVTHRTCIITDFLSLSSCLSFPESCKWCAGLSLSRPTSRNRPLQQGLTPPRLGLSGAADAATKRYQSSFGSVS